jgi:putative regulator of septum formation
VTDEPTPNAAPPPDDTLGAEPAAEPPAAEAQALSPDSGPPPEAAAAPAPWEPPATATPAATKRSGRGRTILIIAVIAVFLGGVLYLVRNNAAADDLKVGECFDVPNQTTVQTVDKHPCTESHGAEVIFVGEYTGDTYPISPSLDSFIEERCVPAFESYVGQDVDAQEQLSIGYFYPSRDSWDSGDRTVTCYVLNTDASPMTESVKGA